jgi:hypothetical protein
MSSSDFCTIASRSCEYEYESNNNNNNNTTTTTTNNNNNNIGNDEELWDDKLIFIQ